MAFEALVDFDTKQEALNMLVDKGILTKHDFELCVKALKKKETSKGLIYKDKFISVSYKKVEDFSTWSGKGIKVYLIVENKTKEPINVNARVCVNGYIVEKDKSISQNLPEKSKTIECVEVLYNMLNVIEVNAIKDIETISFVFHCIDNHYKEIFKSNKISEITLNV